MDSATIKIVDNITKTGEDVGLKVLSEFHGSTFTQPGIYVERIKLVL